jgi:hypothetical protein
MVHITTEEYLYVMKFIDLLKEELTVNELKKCKLIWNLYKTGVFTDNDNKYKYYLNDEHVITSSSEGGNPIIAVRGNMYTTVRIYRMEDNGHLVLLDYELNNTIHSFIKLKIVKKFAQHNIRLSI